MQAGSLRSTAVQPSIDEEQGGATSLEPSLSLLFG
jgi:hypothetical protein